MTQENKELILKDLCARLPYGVKIHLNADMYPNWKGDYNLTAIKSIKSSQVQCSVKQFSCWSNLEDIKPYLFPMSSMTDEQHTDMFNYYHNAEIEEVYASGDYLKAAYIGDDKKYEWLNRNHFDYRGLIEKGLALDATGLNIY